MKKCTRKGIPSVLKKKTLFFAVCLKKMIPFFFHVACLKSQD